LIALLEDALRDEVKERLERVLELQIHADGPVPEAREYVEAMLGLQIWANGIFTAIRSTPHDAGSAEHGH
jgi:hypothetical protein